MRSKRDASRAMGRTAFLSHPQGDSAFIADTSESTEPLHDAHVFVPIFRPDPTPAPRSPDRDHARDRHRAAGAGLCVDRSFQRVGTAYLRSRRT